MDFKKDELAVSLDEKGNDEPYYCRAGIAIIIFIVHIISYADRFNISVAILSMSEEYGYSTETQGLILASFFYGYIVTQFVAGAVSTSASQVGPKWCLIFACACWSVVTLLTPACADASLGLLIGARVALGLAEGLYVPSVTALYSNWFPLQERARITALGNCGQMLGTVIAMACSPVVAYNWRIMFYIFGGLGLVWCAIFFYFGSAGPESHRAISERERSYIMRSRRTMGNEDRGSETIPMRSTETSYGIVGSSDDRVPEALKETPYWRIGMHPAFWAVAAAHFANNWSVYILLSWLPKFYVDAFNVSKAHSGTLSLWPYVAAAVAVIAWAKVFDGALETGRLSVLGARKLAQTISVVGQICAFLVILFWGGSRQGRHGSLGLTVALVTAAVALQAASLSGYFVNLIDIGGQANASRVAAFSNTLATVPGFVGNIVVGSLIDGHGGWPAVFVTMILVHLPGLLLFLTFAQARPVRF